MNTSVADWKSPRNFKKTTTNRPKWSIREGHRISISRTFQRKNRQIDPKWSGMERSRFFYPAKNRTCGKSTLFHVHERQKKRRSRFTSWRKKDVMEKKETDKSTLSIFPKKRKIEGRSCFFFHNRFFQNEKTHFTAIDPKKGRSWKRGEGKKKKKRNIHGKPIPSTDFGKVMRIPEKKKERKKKKRIRQKCHLALLLFPLPPYFPFFFFFFWRKKFRQFLSLALPSQIKRSTTDQKKGLGKHICDQWTNGTFHFYSVGFIFLLFLGFCFLFVLLFVLHLICSFFFFFYWKKFFFRILP